MARSKWFAIATVVLLALSSLFVPSAHLHAAGTWYVSPSGFDSNSCNSPAQACLTIQRVLNVAGSGDTIKVVTATYTAASGSQVITISQSVVLSGGWNTAF